MPNNTNAFIGCIGCDADNGILNFNEPFIIIISGVIDTKAVNAFTIFLSKLFKIIACRSSGRNGFLIVRGEFAEPIKTITCRACANACVMT